MPLIGIVHVSRSGNSRRALSGAPNRTGQAIVIPLTDLGLSYSVLSGAPNRTGQAIVIPLTDLGPSFSVLSGQTALRVGRGLFRRSLSSITARG